MRLFSVMAACATLGLGCGSSSTKRTDAGDAGTDAGDAAIVGDAAVLTALQARGKYLVEAVIACSDCHTPPGADGRPDMTKFLAGNPGFVFIPGGDGPDQMLPTRNLTNHQTGLKNRTDEEIKDMFLNGQRPLETGGVEYLNPVMPYYVFHNMKDEDANAIVAYLRTVPGIDNPIPRRTELFDVPQPAPALDLASVPEVADDAENKESAVRGRYLATQVGLCVECHTQHLAPGAPSVLDEAHIFEGGEDYSALFAATLKITPVSKNLTSDPDTGLGTWTADDIFNALHKGLSKDGSGICPPMPLGSYAQLTTADATDIANYIHSLPPKVHAIPDMCVFPPATGPAAGSDAGDDVASTPDGGTGT